MSTSRWTGSLNDYTLRDIPAVRRPGKILHSVDSTCRGEKKQYLDAAGLKALFESDQAREARGESHEGAYCLQCVLARKAAIVLDLSPQPKATQATKADREADATTTVKAQCPACLIELPSTGICDEHGTPDDVEIELLKTWTPEEITDEMREEMSALLESHDVAVPPVAPIPVTASQKRRAAKAAKITVVA